MPGSGADPDRVLSYVAEVRPGAVLNQKYRIEHPISEGGMGAIYAAHHVQLGMKLAVKVILPSLLESDEAIRRFDREARAAAKIANEHVVRILDVGQLESGAPYMVLEFLEGQNGVAYLEEHAPLSIDNVIDFVVQACAAVAAAHAHGIIHRDLKPSNLIFVPRSEGLPLVKVLDFGLSKFARTDGQDSLTLTKSGWGLGSPAYASPEQWRDSRRSDKRSDIWALGVILYEFLTRTVPFDGENVALMGMNVAGADPTPPRQLRPEISADLERIVLKCLEKNADDRFQDVEALSKALRACHSRHKALESSSTSATRWDVLSVVSTGTYVLIALAVVAVIATSLYGRGPVATQRPSENTVGSDPGPKAGPPAPVSSAAAQSAPSIASASSVPAQRAPSVAAGSPPAPPSPAAPPEPVTAQRHPAPTDLRAQQADESVRRSDAGTGLRNSRCNPPYYFDPHGNRVYKVDCL
jgi:serine/threonine-protein kinase